MMDPEQQVLNDKHLALLIKHFKPLVLSPLCKLGMTSSTVRWRCKQIAEQGYTEEHTDHEYEGDGSVHSLRQWLVQFPDDAPVGWGEYELGVTVTTRKYATAAEIKAAKQWLLDNPPPEPQPIKWRKPLDTNNVEAV